MEVTGTMKHRKVEYQKEGFKVADYWMPPGSETYVRLTPVDRQALVGGKSKL
ncbi:hypothetical protein M427DRAFT_56531 [Gonapodya prolifera JEL478]|uniref:Uncharacterized protein n=1 Tax=Gonapodya prolifera (strain JEL478) TaxID=1344416 RepID=A0A139AFW5_GONPJ|nr:hypothetical protein M427DRAFT_56531 [Gonapodya prolifera JEL478]|eukprot:KXS15701.1 hypothetical protein M427DRAFT_56531 [Gonapodya prolifera JEL478]